MRDSRETDEVLVCMAQRLQGQLERQLTLVERVQDGSARDAAVTDLAELRTSLQRTLRGAENLLVLGGAQQGPRVRGPRTIADVLADARAGVEDAARIWLGPASGATVAPRAVAGLVALFTELLNHGITVSPALARVEVASSRSEDGGILVEVTTDGPGPTPGELDELNRRLGEHPIIDDVVSNRVGLFVAARLARRSGAALRVQHLRGGAMPATGLVAVVHCPPGLLDAVDFAAPTTGIRPWEQGPPPNGRSAPVGSGPASTFEPAHGAGLDDDYGNGLGNGTPRRAPERRPDEGLPVRLDDWPAATHPTSTAPADELFGPLPTLPPGELYDKSATPIYEAVASAWFVREISGRRRRDSGGPEDWSTPSDPEWRAASKRAARPEGGEPTTSAGLPRRRPGTQMVAPSRHEAPVTARATPDRAPDRVRERLAVYQQGIERGRHRAAEPDQDG